MKRQRWHSTLVLAGALLLALAAPAMAQLQTGNLYGTVTDNEGEALPGVTITLSGIGAPKLQVTNAEGQFRFLSLPPGAYQLTAELEGFSTVEYPNVTIAVGRNANIEVTLSPAIEETITVTAETPLLDSRSLSRGSNVSVEELDKIPTARDPWSLLNQAPGVLIDRINVGGNESGQQSAFLGPGAFSEQNTFAIDGVILTDMAATGASLSYYDFGAFEEVQFTTGSTDVSIATAGVTVNQVTKRGGNQWRGSGRYLLTDGDLQSDPPQVVSNGNLLDGNRIESVEEYGADIGGPLWKDKLWLWAAYGESDIQNIVIGGQLDRTMLEDFNTKLNFQASKANSGVLHYWTNDKLKNGRGAAPNRAPETTHNQITPADIWKFEDTHVFSSNFFLTGLWSNNDGVFNAAPQGGNQTNAYWDENGNLFGSYWDFAQNGVVDQARLDASYFFNTGGASHELRFGAGFREQDNESGTVWPNGRLHYACEWFGCAAGTPSNVEYVQFWRNTSVAISSTYESAWVQDTISKDRWTINVGVRYDQQEAENGSSVSPAQPDRPDLLPELNFPGNDAGGFEWEDIVPRIGVTYAMGEERKTLLRGSFSRYADQLGHALASRVSPLGSAYAAFYFTDLNGNLILDPNETGSLVSAYNLGFDPSNPTALSSPNRNDPNLEAPITDELTFGAEHAFKPDFVGGITVTWRNYSDVQEERLFIDDNGVQRIATRNDWVLSNSPACPSSSGGCALPGGGTVSDVPVYNLAPGLTNLGAQLRTNGDREQDYLGITLNATKRLSNRWTMRGHLTWSDWDWDIGPQFRAFDDPTDTTVDNNNLDFSDGDEVVFERSEGSGSKGNIIVNSRWSFNVNGLYQVAPDQPWGFNVGGSITGREGYISPAYANVSGPSRRVQLTAIDAFRNDDVIYFDARVDKDFNFGDWGMTVSIDGFNLTNEDYVLQRERNIAGGSANVIRETMSPRAFRLGFKFNFR